MTCFGPNIAVISMTSNQANRPPLQPGSDAVEGSESEQELRLESEIPQDKEHADQNYVLTLYISGASPRSSAALITIQGICDRELKGRVELKVVDIREHPEALIEDRILAIPTLIKRLPPPLRQIIGDLANEHRVRVALDLIPPPPQN